jgi:hypothetical protein
MANRPALGVSQIPLLLQKLGLATGGQSGASDVERMLSQLSGPRLTNSLTPVANAESIGAGNANLNNLMQSSYPNIFGYVGQDAANSLAWAQQAQARREAAEAQAKQAALQAKLLQAQKKAALSGLGGGTGGTGTINTNTGGSYNLPWNSGNKTKPSPIAGDKLKLDPVPDTDLAPLVAPPVPRKGASAIEWAAYRAALAVVQNAAKAMSNRSKSKSNKKPKSNAKK